MAKVLIRDNKAIIQSELKSQDYDLLRAVDSGLLCLQDDNGDTTFSVCVSMNPVIYDHKIKFNSVDNYNNMCVSADIPDEVADKEEDNIKLWFFKKYGMACINLCRLEHELPQRIRDAKEKKDYVDSLIVFV